MHSLGMILEREIGYGHGVGHAQALRMQNNVQQIQKRLRLAQLNGAH